MPIALLGTDFTATPTAPTGLPPGWSFVTTPISSTANSTGLTSGSVPAPYGFVQPIGSSVNQTRGGSIVTSFDAGAAAITYAPTGQKALRFRFWLRMAHTQSGSLPGTSFNSRSMFALCPFTGNPATRKALRFGINITPTSNCFFVIDKVDYAQPSVAPTILGNTLVRTLSASPLGQDAAFDLVFVYDADGAYAYCSEVNTGTGVVGPALGLVQIPKSQITSWWGVLTTADLRTLPFFLHLHLLYQSDATTPGNPPHIDNVFVFDDLSGQGASPAAPPWYPPSYTVLASVMPSSPAEPVLATLAGSLVGNAENDASSAVLTVMPSYSLEITDGYKIAEHPFDGGYVATQSLTSKRRRSWKFHWDHIDATELVTLLTLASTVEGRVKSFTWTDAETAEVIRLRFTSDIESKHLAGSGATGVYSATASVEEVHA